VEIKKRDDIEVGLEGYEDEFVEVKF